MEQMLLPAFIINISEFYVHDSTITPINDLVMINNGAIKLLSGFSKFDNSSRW